MEKITFDRLNELDYGVTEALRTLKTNIQFCGDDIKTILLTSSIPGEGKSTVALNLVRSMVESGQKIIYVDCDIRKSVVIGRFGVRSEDGKKIFGLSHYLSGQKKLDDVIYDTEIEGMNMIFAGPSVPNPTEMLGNHYFKEMLQNLRENYDVVIVDTPPLGSVIDAAVVAPQVDGAILVIEQGKVSRRFIKEVKKQLDNSGVKILGVVLNKVEVKKQGYYKKYYGNAYE
jgi:capsular exopolysaccharide synthesis family protein